MNILERSFDTDGMMYSMVIELPNHNLLNISLDTENSITITNITGKLHKGNHQFGMLIEPVDYGTITITPEG